MSRFFPSFSNLSIFQETRQSKLQSSQGASGRPSSALSYLQDNLPGDSRGEAPSQTLSTVSPSTGLLWAPLPVPSGQQKSKNSSQGPGRPSTPPKPGSGSGHREKGPSFSPCCLLWGGGRQNLSSLHYHPARLGIEETSVWSLEAPQAPTLCWESTATNRSHPGSQGKLCPLQAGAQGHHPMAQGLRLPAPASPGPGLQMHKAARA